MAAAMLGGWHDGVAHRSGPHLELPGSSAEHHEHRGFQNCEACKVGELLRRSNDGVQCLPELQSCSSNAVS